MQSEAELNEVIFSSIKDFGKKVIDKATSTFTGGSSASSIKKPVAKKASKPKEASAKKQETTKKKENSKSTDKKADTTVKMSKDKESIAAQAAAAKTLSSTND